MTSLVSQKDLGECDVKLNKGEGYLHAGESLSGNPYRRSVGNIGRKEREVNREDPGHKSPKMRTM